MSASLPECLNLGQLRTQAKELRDAASRGEPGALDRVTRNYRPASQGPLTLAAAQLVLVRELGFANWPRLKAAAESRAATAGQRAGPSWRPRSSAAWARQRRSSTLTRA